MKTTKQERTSLRPANFFLVPILPYLDPATVSKLRKYSVVQTWPAEYCGERMLFALD